MLSQVVIALHVFAVIFWIGSITVVGWLLANQASAPSADKGATAAELALSLYRRVAAPAFVLAFALGLTAFSQNLGFYKQAHWMHAKLTLALGVIALHHILGARAKRAASAAEGGAPAQNEAKSRASSMLTAGLVFCALGVVVLVVLKGSLVP